MLQETRSENSCRKQCEGEIICNHGNPASKGVAILISNKAGLTYENICKDPEGRWVKADFAWGENKITLISVYAPNPINARIVFFRYIDNMSKENIIIIGGDFNCHLDKTAVDDRSKIDFINILKRHGLKDVWRTIHNENPGHTTYQKGLSKPGRIDYFLLPLNYR